MTVSAPIPGPDLKKKVVSGMAILLLRYAAGLVISVASVALIYRGVAAKEYGLVVLSQSIWFYVCTVASLGLDVFIIKESDSLDDNTVRHLFFYQVLSLLTGYCCVSFILWIAPFNANPLFPKVASVIGISYVIRNLALVPNSRLESQLNYAPSGKAEVQSQVIYVLALAIFFWLRLGIFAICLAMVLSSLFYSIQILRMGRMLPKPAPLDPEIKGAVRYGLTTQANTWLWQVKDFAVPQILALLAGTEFVGILGLVTQITQKLSFIRQIIWRVSLSAISKIKYDTAQLLQSVQFAASTQATILSFIFITIGILLRGVEEYGSRNWFGISHVFPAVALGMLVNGIFSVGCAALMVLGKLRVLFWFHLTFVVIYLLVISMAGWLGPLNAFYGAEIAACVAYVSLWSSIKGEIGAITVFEPLMVVTITVSSLVASAFVGFHVALIVLVFTAVTLTAITTVRSSLLYVYNDIMQLLKLKKGAV